MRSAIDLVTRNDARGQVRELRVPLDPRDERGLPAIHVAAGAGQVRLCRFTGFPLQVT
jgi:hypothetical protein